MSKIFSKEEIFYVPVSAEKILDSFNYLTEYMNKKYDEVFQVYDKSENKIILRSSKGLGFFFYLYFELKTNEVKDVMFKNNQVLIKSYCDAKFEKTKDAFISSGELIENGKASVKHLLTNGYEFKEVGKAKVSSDFKNIVTIFWLGLCFPIGLYRMWRDRAFPLYLRITITSVLLLLWSLVLFS
jgi:hypothetical protein